MTSSLRKIRQNLGLPPKAITSGLQLPELATREQLDAIRDQAMVEMDRDGYSENYLIWSEALRRGLDQSLPSMRDIQGLASDSREVLQESLAALKSSKQAFIPEQMDPLLVGMQFNGKPIEDADAHEVLDFLHSSMADSAPSERGELLELIDAVKSSPFGTTTNGVEINMPDTVQTYEVPSEEEETGDPYTDAMAAPMRQPQGLEDLAIGDGFGLDGLKGVGGGGGQYSVAHDMGYQQALARAEEGDDE